MEQSILPKEITQDCDTGINTASFEFYSGVRLAKKLGLNQTTNTDKGNFMVCCGDVMFTVEPNDYPTVKRRIF